MDPWIIILLIAASIVFGIDYLLRRKKWKDNTKAEKTSLLINMITAGMYFYLSALGFLWGIAGNSPESALGAVLYDITLTMGGLFFIVAIAAAISSLILRKFQKTKASIWVNIIALAYIVVVLTVNYLIGALM